MKDTPLFTKSVVSNTSGFSSLRGIEKDSLIRNGALEIKLAGALGPFSVSAYGPLFLPPKTWSTNIALSPEELFELTQECRMTWQTKIIDYVKIKRTSFSDKKTFPFQNAWDFRTQPELLAEQCPHLALAGERLFSLIFETSSDPLMKDIAVILRSMTIEGEAVFTITAEDFFVPWSMIYTHPIANEKLNNEGSNFKPEGFWGYRHIIEHNTRYSELDMAIGSDSSRLLVSLNIDANIDSKLRVSTIKAQRDFFDDLDRLQLITKEERQNKKQLQEALQKTDFSDRLVYFYCHGQGGDKADQPNLSSASLRLTDGEAITRNDLKLWRQSTELSSHPLIFINACQGGQMTTLFYQTIATEFLRQKAVGLIGSQVDIPAPFAAEYARRLLSRFINSSQPSDQKVKLGPLMRELTREFYDSDKNPLGLVYSLYRGADCYINRRARPAPV